jgi:membrane-associated protease RseP (regulator of RpoE activity)
MDSLTTLTLFIAAWFVVYGVLKLTKIDRPDLEIQPLYILFKSTRLNNFISRLAAWNPKFWRVIGNIGVVSSIGQASFATWLLTNNLLRFIFKPEQATPVQPLIPGVTISISSLPWFMLAAGVVILTHELSHGIQCVLEGVKVKSSAIMLAVITFGGAIEPDEEELTKSSIMSRMRIFAAGSIVNLITGLLIIIIMTSFRGLMPDFLGLFLSWLYFISINLAMMNMLPIGPLDGGQMWRTFTDTLPRGKQIQTIATYAFIVLILGNIVFSLNMFGLVPI